MSDVALENKKSYPARVVFLFSWYYQFIQEEVFK